MKKILIICLFLLCSCANKQDHIINTNNFYQNNYTTMPCFDGTKTFSKIIVCLQEIDAKEKAQNNITNEMLSNE